MRGDGSCSLNREGKAVPKIVAPIYEGVIERVGKMDASELKRAKQSIETSLDLGKSALRAIDAQLKQRGR